MRLKQISLVPLLLLLAAVVPVQAQQLDLPEEAVSDDTNVAVYMDWSALTPEALQASADAVIEKLPQQFREQMPIEGQLDMGIAQFRQFRQQFQEAGGKGVLMLATSQDLIEGNEPLAVVQVEEGTDAETFQVPNQPAEFQQLAGNWLVAVDQADRVAGGSSEQAEQLAQLLAEAQQDAAIHAAFVMTDEMKQEIQEVAQNPQEAGPAAALLPAMEGLETATASIQFGDGPQLRKVMNFADEQAATQFQDAWSQMLSSAEQMVNQQVEMLQQQMQGQVQLPDAEQVSGLFESMQLQQDGDQLTLVIGDEALGQIAEMLPAAMGVFMQMQMQQQQMQQQQMQQQDPPQNW
ncbi:MAG: hypothetical protein ACOCTI_01900 [Phycisphaeraceae bacterium]